MAQVLTRPIGICQRCSVPIVLEDNGTVPNHNREEQPFVWRRCIGSGKIPDSIKGDSSRKVGK
jgi:hypothetical protein